MASQEPLLVQRFLGPPAQSFQIGIFSCRSRGPFRLLSLPLYPTGFFLPLFHLPGFFSIAFRDSRFACSCDGVLLLFTFPDQGRK